MELSKRALTSTAKKLAVTAVVAFAAVSANAFTLSAVDAVGTASGSFTSATAFEASGFASIDTGSLLSFTLYSGIGTSGAVVGTAFSPFAGNLFFAPATFGAGTYTVAISGVGASQFDGYFATTAAVPEPETYALFFAGLGAVGFLTRRRNNG